MTEEIIWIPHFIRKSSLTKPWTEQQNQNKKYLSVTISSTAPNFVPSEKQIKVYVVTNFQLLQFRHMRQLEI